MPTVDLCDVVVEGSRAGSHCADDPKGKPPSRLDWAGTSDELIN